MTSIERKQRHYECRKEWVRIYTLQQNWNRHEKQVIPCLSKKEKKMSRFTMLFLNYSIARFLIVKQHLKENQT